MEVHKIFAEIEIEDTIISHYYSIYINQGFNRHHEFAIKIPHDVFETKGSFNLDHVMKLIGKNTLIRFYERSKKSILNEFKGIITDVSVEQSNAYESQIFLKGFSPTILLENNPHITCFAKKKLSKIVEESTKALLSECSVSPKPVFTRAIEYLIQYKESNFQFLNRLSADFGEWFFYDGKQLFFGKPSALKEIDITLGADVYSLKQKLQVLPMAIKAWAYHGENDKTVVATTPANVNGLGQYGKIAAKESDKLYTEVASIGDYPIELAADSDTDIFLKIQKTAIAAQLEIVTGTSANPEIKLGQIATINISKKANNAFTKKEYGKFLITNVTHEFSEDGKYLNHFEGIPSAIEVIPVKDVKRPVAEPQTAFVTDNNDPLNIGRVKVQMLWQEGNVKTDWIYTLTGDAGKGGKTGKNRGIVFIPEVGDLVILGFYHNDPSFPYVSGSRFLNKTAAGGGKDNKVKTISTNSGNTITLNDDKGSMLFEDAKGNSVHLDGSGKIFMKCSEQIELKTGDSSITMKKDGTIQIVGKMKIEVTSDQTVSIEGKTKVDMKSNQAVNIEGTSEVGIKGTNISAKANANLNLEANANLSAKATANLSLEGTAMAKLSSAAMAEISAALVKIN